MKCGYSGCKNKATLLLKSKVKNAPNLPVCDDCAPAWAKENNKIEFYTVQILK
jgi:hypothetical protein